METAGIILAVTPLVRLVLEALGLLKEGSEKQEKIKHATHVASAAGLGVLAAHL